MPNAQVLNEKKAVVAALIERLKNASAGVFVDFHAEATGEKYALAYAFDGQISALFSIYI